MAEIIVSSGGSGEPALDFVAAAFEKATGHTVKVRYNDESCVGDVVFASTSILERKLRPAGSVEAGGVSVGRVGLGVAIRQGAPAPDIADLAALKRSLLDTDRLLITKNHTSGLYVESMLKTIGIYARMEVRLERLLNAPVLLHRLLAGSGREFTILSINEIRTYENKGVVRIGPLPAEVQHHVDFVAVPAAASSHKDIAWAFARFCGGPGRSLLDEHGFDG